MRKPNFAFERSQRSKAKEEKAKAKEEKKASQKAAEAPPPAEAPEGEPEVR